MGKINLGRVILGGIVAGIVIDIFEGVLNGVVLAKQWADVMTQARQAWHDLNEPDRCFQRVGTCCRNPDGLGIRVDAAAPGCRSENGNIRRPCDLGDGLRTRQCGHRVSAPDSCGLDGYGIGGWLGGDDDCGGCRRVLSIRKT